jgi:RNA polymerase sigma-70 factor (ECF subfamily)
MDDKPAADRELSEMMSQYQDGKAAALEVLVRRLSPGLMRYFRMSGVATADAEDLLQECWMRIHRSRHTYRPSEPLMPWVFAIARHTRLDGYRKRRRLESREVLFGEIPDHIQPRTPQASESGDEMSALLASLPESQREVVLMLKVAGMSLQEVARATSSTVGAVKQKAHRAYVALDQALEELKHGRKTTTGS